MSDDSDSIDEETNSIPTLDVMAGERDDTMYVIDGHVGKPFADTALEHISARIDRELQREFDQTVTGPVNDAVNQALASYGEKVRALVLRELVAHLGQGSTRGEPE